MNIGVPTQVEICIVDPRNWPFPCHEQFPQFKYVSILSGTSDTAGTMALGFSGFTPI